MSRPRLSGRVDHVCDGPPGRWSAGCSCHLVDHHRGRAHQAEIAIGSATCLTGLTFRAERVCGSCMVVGAAATDETKSNDASIVMICGRIGSRGASGHG